ncbi:MAG: eukaryotic-like serine/threonine-protein kinase, partial [Acidobacteriota bacterium]|nr:eukaryotic-like serine/threonine-protein kinase [Acidobacteriota bacterium]
MSSVSDRDDRVMTLMAAAMTVAADQRSSYLRSVCGGDEELFHDICDAIEWEQRMGGFLLKPWMSLQELERPFRPGQVVNHRFDIIREIGQGGMGVVYEAFDRKRGRRIAIKSAKLGFRRLLSPELESALKVRHPNVCLVNEIHTAATDHGDVDFLTMEFLDGPTLQERLSSAGRLSSDEALEIVRQLCAGLAEAHRMEILHKDLKPANVILTRFPDGSPRAVITDFGLAGEPALGSGDLAGTPHYMAPELWQGATASKASDLYALGVIAYEMVTGGMPYADEPTQARLTCPPPPPGTRAGGLDKRWDTAILRCLDPSPAVRPHDATELLASLTARSIRKLPLLAAMLVVLILTAVAVRGTFRAWFAPLPNIRLAILPISGTDDVSAAGEGALIDVADRLSQRKESPTLVVIPASRSLDNGVHTPEQARQVFDATHALQIALRREGNTLVALGAVVDLSTSTRLEEISWRYSAARADDLSAALIGAVSKALHLKDVPAERPSAAASAPYYEGLFYLRRDQHSFANAIPLFRKAASLDPRSPLPPAGLAEALVLQYQDEKEPSMLDEADRLLQEARALNPDSVPVLMAAGRLALARGGHSEQALQNYRRVAELRPHNVEVWLRVAQVYDRQSLRKEAVESY